MINTRARLCDLRGALQCIHAAERALDNPDLDPVIAIRDATQHLITAREDLGTAPNKGPRIEAMWDHVLPLYEEMRARVLRAMAEWTATGQPLKRDPEDKTAFRAIITQVHDDGTKHVVIFEDKGGFGVVSIDHDHEYANVREWPDLHVYMEDEPTTYIGITCHDVGMIF